MTRFECACTTQLDGVLAVEKDNSLIRFRAYGISWKLSFEEARVLARDIECIISEGEPYDDGERSVIVGDWDDMSLVLKLDKGGLVIILDSMYAEMLADWLKEVVG